MYSAKMDERGRVKLPTAFQEYLAGLENKKLFVTSLDRRIARIYPMEVWRQNEKFFQEYRDNPGLAKKAAFNAADLGAEAEMDSQGRITFPAELRQELGLEDQTLRLHSYKGRIEVLSQKIYEDRKRQALTMEAEDLEKLESAGLN